MRALPIVFLCWAGCLAAQDLEPVSRHAFATLDVSGAPRFMAVDGDGVWITNTDRIEKLTRPDATPIVTVRIAGVCGIPVVDFNAVWVADCDEQAIHRINRFDGNRVATLRVAGIAGTPQPAAGAGSIWLVDAAASQLLRIDPRTNGVKARIAVASGSHAAAFGFDSVWITSTKGNSVQRIDARLNRVVATIAVGPSPLFLAAGEQAVWVLNQGDGTVTRIDPARNASVATIDAEASGQGGGIDTGAGRVWVRGRAPMLSVIDPRMNRVVARYGPGDSGGAVRVSPGAIWISSFEEGAVHLLPAPLNAD